jgi:hypothetical protein
MIMKLNLVMMIILNCENLRLVRAVSAFVVIILAAADRRCVFS